MVAVLWIVMALSIIVTGLSRSVRDEAKMISAARQGAHASALGDAAIQLVLQQMAVDSKPVDRMVTVPVQYQGQQMAVQVMPLNGLVDINSAQPALLARLLVVAGGLPDSAAATSELAEVIITRPRPSRARQPASIGKSTSKPRPSSGEGRTWRKSVNMTSLLPPGQTDARALRSS